MSDKKDTTDSKEYDVVLLFPAPVLDLSKSYNARPNEASADASPDKKAGAKVRSVCVVILL